MVMATATLKVTATVTATLKVTATVTATLKATLKATVNYVWNHRILQLIMLQSPQ
jgi:hypothetical protein